MFADSLLESPWADRSRRGWTTLLSFTAQMLGVGILLALPLIYTEGLPTLKLITSGAPLAPPPGPPPEAHQVNSGRHPIVSGRHVIVVPIALPTHGVQPEVGEPEQVNECLTCVPGGTGDPRGVGIVTSVGPAPPPIPVPPKPAAKPPRISARVQGAVVLRAVISRSGTIENLQVLTGHPLLTSAALDAVRQWRYRPYILNGEPVVVETQVTVNFLLAGN